ncbi:MAG: transposase [Globicatella sulfidifaciens]|uniref:Transposase n=1 Tax=Globicatella sulfidifaciens TaxID=136093 RepID=A0A7X8C5H6_9LACT|nr:transposase [Globicatella sulfidifaciens]
MYVEEIKEWKEQCLSANTTRNADPDKLKNSLKEEQIKNKALQKELRRKEKALAETAALLVLRKKAQAIWGDNEDE